MKRSNWGELMMRIAATVGLCLALLWVLSCSSRRESDQRLQEQAQQATVQAKIAAEKAAADARVAAQHAAQDTRAIAAGVRAGLHSPTGAGTVNLNSASREQLETLPGVGATLARRIQAHRPYAHADDLVRKGVVTQREYDRIASDVTAR